MNAATRDRNGRIGVIAVNTYARSNASLVQALTGSLYFDHSIDYIASVMARNILYWIVFFGTIAGCATSGPEPGAVGAADRVQVSDAQRSEALLQVVLALGSDYRYGGDSQRTGFDCSGLVAHVFEEAWGVHLPHSAEAQSEAGIPVSLTELQPGDLVFYNTQHRPHSHVGIYVGNGRFVHAPKTGARVRFENLRDRYWARRFDGARRIQPPPAS